MGTRSKIRLLTHLACVLIAVTVIPGALAQPEEEVDPARNTPLACEFFTGPLGIPSLLLPGGRSHRNIRHVANRCGFVGTDIEFQSRVDRSGTRHDFAFVGSMGGSMRIFDITNPLNPTPAGLFSGYLDPGWENDVQVHRNIAVVTFDTVAGEPFDTGSICLKNPLNTQPGYLTNADQGIDILSLNYDASTATFQPSLLACVGNPPGGAHNVTIHPSGKYLTISNCCSDFAMDVVKLDPTNADPTKRAVLRYRVIDESRRNTTSTTPPGARCPSTATFTCIVMKRPPAPALGSSETNVPDASSSCPSETNGQDAQIPCGLWRPHDIHFSADGRTAYVAAINSTFIVNVGVFLNAFGQFRDTGVTEVPAISIIPNIHHGGTTADPHNIEISHQSDVTSDGRILVVSDERGGGLDNTSCNEDPEGIIGGLHFFALGQVGSVTGSPSNPVNLGDYFNPDPSLALEPLSLEPLLTEIGAPRAERGCTAHVFRLGGNGTMSPGSPGFDGVSGLPPRQLAEAWYGAGTWMIDFAGPTLPNRVLTTGGETEDPRSTWGNTLGWNVQFGADTWSAKEYKGFIFASDMVRGFDVFQCTNDAGAAISCTSIPSPNAVVDAPPAPADPIVALTKTGPATATRGGTITYTIGYTNLGPATSQRARISDRLPSQVSFVSATGGAQYSSFTRTVTWNVGDVPPGGGGSVTLTVRVSTSAPSGSTITNTATYTSPMTTATPTATATTRVQ